MGKTERMFPLNTMGGRIQNRRINVLKKTRPEFYDLVRPGEKIGNDSKSRTIKNWESGETIPDIDTIKKICNILDCSSDYLLGLDECTSKDTQFIQDKTGLSEKAINSLAYTKSIKSKRVLNAINILICNLFEKENEESKLSFFELFANYLHFSGCNSEYYISTNGKISPAEPYEAANGKKYHPTNKLLFYSNQLEQMYIMEIEDELKSIKKNMNKAPDTD